VTHLMPATFSAGTYPGMALMADSGIGWTPRFGGNFDPPAALLAEHVLDGRDRPRPWACRRSQCRRRERYKNSSDMRVVPLTMWTIFPRGVRLCRCTVGGVTRPARNREAAGVVHGDAFVIPIR